MEELVDILEFCAFIELMIVVQPVFNSNPQVRISDPEAPVATQVQYLHLATTRSRMRSFLLLLDDYFTIQPISSETAPHQTITEAFQLVLDGTTSELCHLFNLFRPESDSELEGLEDEDPLSVPHYDLNECGMRCSLMLENLQRVMGFWGLKEHVERRGVWGSAILPSEHFCVVRKPVVRRTGAGEHCKSLLHFHGSLINIYSK
jgi:hypothetical protein